MKGPHGQSIECVSLALNRGEIAIVPTDTVYGLAASIDCPSAIEEIFRVKGRAFDKPIPILVDGLESATRMASCLPEASRRLAAAFWPGALTIVVPASNLTPSRCLGPGSTVGLRMPDHPLMLELLSRCGGRLAVTSANRSGMPEFRTAAAAQKVLNVEVVLDGGKTPGGTASTVVDVTTGDPKILRSGAIVASRIYEALA